eukprot:6173633-Pleurochrysis_carterae.AAC.3
MTECPWVTQRLCKHAKEPRRDAKLLHTCESDPMAVMADGGVSGSHQQHLSSDVESGDADAPLELCEALFAAASAAMPSSSVRRITKSVVRIVRSPPQISHSHCRR